MFTTITVKKAKEPKFIKKNLFVTKQINPKNDFEKKIIKINKSVKKPKIDNIIHKPKKLKEPKKEIEKKEEIIEPKIFQTTKNIIIQPKLPCNLFCIFHNQNKLIKNQSKNSDTLLQKKRMIDEENGNTIGRWRPEEHKKFIEAIIKYGNNWKDVEKYIDTRTSTQARSHAQKYFEKMKKNKYLKFIKPLNLDCSDNFTNSTIMQLHKLYGSKSKSEINSIVNKFINIESDNMKKKRRSVHPYIGNKKQSFSGNKDNSRENEENNNIEEKNENNENKDEENNLNNLNNNNKNKTSSIIDELYKNNISQKNEEDNYNFNCFEKNFNLPYRKDEIKYILNELVKNVSHNYCDYDPLDIKSKGKRKNTFNSLEEDDSAYLEDNNIAYLNQYNISNNINNNQNINVMTKSRRNSIESLKFPNEKIDYLNIYPGLDESKLSYDINDVLARNIFEDNVNLA